MQPWSEPLRRIAGDDRLGAAALTERVAKLVADLDARADVLRAARIALRSKPAMAPLWHLFGHALEHPGDPSLAVLVARWRAERDAAARNAAWLAGAGRRLVVVTWSDSATLAEAIGTLAPRIAEVRCARSEPGGEGRRLAARLRRRGIAARAIADAELARSLDDADLALLGADAIGGRIAAKVGARALATLAGAARVGCYAIAGASKLLPADLVDAHAHGAFEAFDATLLDGIVTQDGTRTPRAIRAAAEAIEIPAALRRLVSARGAARARLA